MPSGRHGRSPEAVSATRRRHVLWLGLLVLIVYVSALGGDFVWRDREDLLLGGYRVHGLSDLGDAFTMTGDAYRARAVGEVVDPAGGSWQPLAILSNTLSWALWGRCSACWHLENVLLHALVVVGLYALGRHLLSHRRHGKRIAGWTAALFAVHPLTVNAVAWIGGRPYLLAAVFAVWSLVLFTRLQATSRSRAGHVNRWLAGLGVTTLAAMLSHEMAYLLPLAALAVAAFESRERGRHPLFGIAVLRFKAVGLILLILAAVVGYRWLVMGGLHSTGGYPTANTFDNVGTALQHFWFLSEQVVLPGEPVVSDARPVTQGWGALETAALLGLLLIVAATLVGLRLGHPSAFGVGWFLLWILPGVGLFPSTHYHNSQVLYLAVWGIAFAVAYAVFLLWRPAGRHLMPGSEVVVYLPLILVLGTVTALSNARWWDHRGLFESEIATDPHYIEGRIELAKLAMEQQDGELAMQHTLAAIEASRDAAYTGYWPERDAYLLLGRAQLEMGLADEAVAGFRTLLEQHPDDADIAYWLGVAQLALGDAVAAEQSLIRALAMRASFAEAAADLGVALAEQGRFAEAEPRLAGALGAGNGNGRRHRAMALALIDRGRLEQAAPHLEATLAERETAEERARLAWVHWQLGRAEAARAGLDMALQLEDETGPYVDWVRAQIEAGQATSEAAATE